MITNPIIILNKNEWIKKQESEENIFTLTNLMCKSKSVKFFFCIAMINNKTQ